MKFTKKEIKDLFFAWILISLAFAILFSKEFGGIFSKGFLFIFLVSLLTAGIGFLLHELAHKLVAQRYGMFAEFQAFYKMIFLAIALSFIGFIFAAPGAVAIRGLITKERNGKISIAGPIVNFGLAIVFLIPFLIGGLGETFSIFFGLGFRINSLLAIFNMIPVMPFDGAKIIAWDKNIYWTVTLASLGLFILSFFI